MSLDLTAPTPVAPLPGEALFSVIGRWFAVTGMADAQAFAHVVMGGRRRVFSLAFPCRLDWLQRELPALNARPIEALVEDFTAAAVYRPFLTATQWGRVMLQLARGSTGSARMLLGVPRGGGERAVLVHCPACLQEQVESCGFGYWPLRFFLPHVTACTVHRLPLEPVLGRCRTSLSTKLCMLGSPSLSGPTPGGRPLEPDSPLVRLSKLVVELHDARLPPIGYELLVRCYRERMAKLGLAEGGGRVFRTALWQRLHQHWDSLPEVRCSSGRKVPAWVTQLYADGEARVRSPLHHLLAIGALFGDVATWCRCLDGARMSIEQPQDAVPPLRGTRYVQLQHWIERSSEGSGMPLDGRVVELLRSGISAREVATLTGMSRFAVYRRLRAQPHLASEWAVAALRATHASRRCDRSNAAKKWMLRHRSTLLACQVEPHVDAMPQSVRGSSIQARLSPGSTTV